MKNDIFGSAMKAYFHHNDEEPIVVHSPDFDDDIISLPYLFRSFKEMPLLEKTALKHCKGKVLDVGCGAGSHSLYLQENKKLKVVSIDISEGAVEICKNRGLKDVRNISFEDINEKFDTLLFLMNGTGIIGKLKKLDNFFKKLKKILHSNGQVLIDSSDLSYLFDKDEDGGIWINAAEGYYGEIQYKLSYKKEESDYFDWLYLDYNSLNLAASKNGFSCTLLQEGKHYDFLAKLSMENKK